jgi:DNA primase
LGLVIERDTGGYYDRFRERLIFPVIDALGRIVAFGGRTLGDDPAKYMNSPESALFNKSRALYGINAAKDGISRERTAVVVEGYTDCVMAHQMGLTNVVATLGTSLTAEHARVLSRYADRMVLVFDSDEAGQKAAERAIEIFFSQQIEVRLASLPKGMDPCEYLLAHGLNDFSEKIVDQATEALEYKWQATRNRLEEEDTVNGRKRAVDEFLRVVAHSLAQSGTDAMSRGFALNQVTKLVEMPIEQVHARVARFQSQLRRTPTEGEGEGVKTTAVSADIYVNAQREILEVLLNRPDLFAAVCDVISEPEEFKDELHRAIAQRLWDYYGRGGQGPISEILGMCESTQLCNIITDLARWGEERENYENTLTGALVLLQRRKADERRQAIRQTVTKAANKYDADTEAAVLKDIQSRLEACHGVKK